jgi:hypothetical protein
MQMAVCYSGTFLPIRLGEPIPISVNITVYGWAYGWVDI